MNIINKSRKIIGINGEPLLPGATIELPKELEEHPSIQDYLKKGVIADANAATTPLLNSEGLSDAEREKIAEEAIARYKAEQEAQAAAQAAKEAEIKALSKMQKADLQTKALGMGIAIADNDTVEVLREKITEAINNQ